MDATNLVAKEVIPASRKLGRDVALDLLSTTSLLLVAKGKNVREWKHKGDAPQDALEAMLGPTGNLRAPTMRVGKTVIVGFNDEMFDTFFG